MDIHCFGIQNGSSFRDSFKDKILEVNEAAAPAITKRETTFGLVGVYWSVGKNFLNEYTTKL